MSHRFSSAFEAVIDSEIDCLYPSRAFFKPDYGYAEGTTWLIMEFCDSGTLQVQAMLTNPDCLFWFPRRGAGSAKTASVIAIANGCSPDEHALVKGKHLRRLPTPRVYGVDGPVGATNCH